MKTKRLSAKKTRKAKSPPERVKLPPPEFDDAQVELLEFDDAQVELLEFNDAVKLGKDFVAGIESNELQIGWLAARIKPEYGAETLKKFAKEIGLPFARVERSRSVA